MIEEKYFPAFRLIASFMVGMLILEYCFGKFNPSFWVLFYMMAKEFKE